VKLHDLRATYRLQLHEGFDLHQAAELADYLAELGVSHVYASPLLQAARGSTHGYDVVDHQRVSRELGGEAAFEHFRRALARRGLGLVVDLVPNHMAIAPENAWWWDVLENGPSSRFASCFDVDWEPPEARLRNLVLVPILGDHYGRVLAAGELRLERAGGSFRVRYFEHALPVAPRSLDELLRLAAARCGSDDLAYLADAFGGLPAATATDEGSVARRHRDKEVLRRALERLLAGSRRIADAVDAVVEAWNADRDALHALLERQNWRIARWRTAERDVAYRRFFDISHLVGIRVEDRRVFEDTHALVLAWVRDGAVEGLRIDHVDGLREPARYLGWLREAAPDVWIGVEKILARDEWLPATWPVDGTTGYEFLSRVLGLFVDPAGEAPLTALQGELGGETRDFASVVREKKRLVLHHGLAADLGRVVALALEACERHPEHRDFTRHELHDALAEIAACFPLYRSYVSELGGPPTADERRGLREACSEARSRRPDAAQGLVDFLEALLARELDGPLERALAVRFQQLTAPAQAKGVEDTAFYTFPRLVALNEVGGDPGVFGSGPEDLHAWLAELGAHHPRTMLATSTHDTKRSEDVRARLVLLSEQPAVWGAFARRLRTLSDRHRGGDAPDRLLEYGLLQNLVGAWPIESERFVAFAEKAAREAKTHTSWTQQDPVFEAGLRAWAEKCLADRELRAEIEAFVAPLVVPGRVNALAQTLIQLTAPGFPDRYQGSELWDASLVDPDNRRPVDYTERRRLLAELAAEQPPGAAEIWARQASGLPKLQVVREALALRARRPGLFGPGAVYTPLAAEGVRAPHAFAYARGGGAVTVVPRLVLGLGLVSRGGALVREAWSDTTLVLPPGVWRNRLDPAFVGSGRIHVGALLARFPVALLEREP